MNWTLLIGLAFVMAGLLCSGELVRRGVFADDREIRQRKRRGDSNKRLMLLMVVFGLVGYIIATWGQS